MALRTIPRIPYDPDEGVELGELFAPKPPTPIAKSMSYRERLLAFNLEGNENSGNHGHAGRPGEVGGSAPSGDPIDRKHGEFMALVKKTEEGNAELEQMRLGMHEAWKRWADDIQNRKKPLKADGAAAKKLDSYKEAKALEDAFHKQYDALRVEHHLAKLQAQELLKVPVADRSTLVLREDKALHPALVNSAKAALSQFRQFDGSGAFVPTLKFPAEKVSEFKEIFGKDIDLKENADGTFSVKSAMGLFKSETGRAHATLSGIHIGGGRDLDRQVFHEVAHHIEMRSPSVLKAAVELRESLATKPREVYSLKEELHALGEDEKALRGNFPDPYTAKLYPGDIATEIISTGVESYITDPVRFAKERPEHFKLIFDVMHGKYRDRS